jgi:RHS repeat-associated protein
MPFGDDLTCTGPEAGNVNPLHFTGKERDAEDTLSGNDYFGARYYSSNFGRFMSPDPLGVTPLDIINPQRWNMYAYGMDSPTYYVDSDGRDAIAVNFSDLDPVVGHEGIVDVNGDGSAEYARFGPATESSPFDAGEVQSFSLATKVQFGSDGLPTPDSYAALAKEIVEKHERNVDPSTVRMNYFKTSAADTLRLHNWIAAVRARKAPPYAFCTSSNCAGFTVSGLLAGRAIGLFTASQLSIVPNILFLELSGLSDQNYTGNPKTQVTGRICDPSGVCQTINK